MRSWPPKTIEISDLELFAVQVECDGQEAPVQSTLVRLVADSGDEGWGEARTSWRAAELPARRDSLLQLMAGRSAFDVEDLLALETLAASPVRTALEIASWDLIGRAVGQPVSNLFGGRYRRRIPLAARLPELPPARAAQLSRQLADRGFHTQILSTCGDVEGDVRAMTAVRQSAGGRTRLQLDAAARYDSQSARDLCAELEYEGLQFLLDPLAAADLYPVAALSRQTSVPLAVRRAIRRPHDVLAAVRCGAASFVVLDLGQVGGMVPVRKSAAVAEAAGVRALLGGGPWLGVGVAAMLQLAAALPALANPNECSYHQLSHDVLTEPLEIVDGMMAVPQGPGLGIEVDRTKVDAYQVG
jgi:L-alanine-DL-glutamate epimerase-like enolase superfamily enzyme